MADISFQRLALRAVLSLPTPILRTLAGGGVVFQGGRTLDPRLQYLTNAARGRGAGGALTPELLRASSAASLALVAGDPEPGVRAEALSIPAPHGAIAARAYRPEAQDPTAPILVFAHFGGGVIGDL